MSVLITGQIADIINARLSAGFTPDSDAFHFLKTSYGIDDKDDLVRFLNDTSVNDGTIYELTIFPDDSLRREIERIIPLRGLDSDEIKTVAEAVKAQNPRIFILIEELEVSVDDCNSSYCRASFIKRLNLGTDLSFIGDKPEDAASEDFCRAKGLLRRRRFIPKGDRGEFIRKFIYNSSRIKNFAIEEFIRLLDNALTLLNGEQENSLDALAVKKYYFESVIAETEEFARISRTYSMEFLMSKRIQPPPVSVDDAVESIRIIDRLTSIAYGRIIPVSDISVQARISRDDPFSGILYPV